MGLAEDIEQAMVDGASEGLRLAALAVLEQAKRNAPVGDPESDPDPNVSLKDTGRIEKTQFGYRVIFDAPYAAKQEFDRRLKHPRGGGSGYLIRALTVAAPRLQNVVAGKVEGNMRHVRPRKQT